MTWIPLHVHSHWSLLDGVPSIPELVDFARESGLPALALTDTNALYGAVDFVARCRKAGIQPIIGAELSLEGDRSAILLAWNQTGYGNLCHRRFADFPEALENTVRIAEACRFELPLDQFHFPTLDLPSGRTPGEALSSREPVVVTGRVAADRQGLTVVLGREIRVVA